MLDLRTIRKSATKFLSYDYPKTVKQILVELAEYADPALEQDDYGKGKIFDLLYSRLAKLFGKPGAVFMPTGRMAQLITLKLWCDHRGISRVGMHPQCHLEEYEHKAYQHAYGLKAVMVGGYNRPVTLNDLNDIREQLGVLHIELPLLALGCSAPTWDELIGISEWSRKHSVPLHLDGARLWECEPYYGHSYAEISALFDTVYVSFYKGLSAMAGGALVGPAEFIRNVQLWQDRLGGNPPKLFPLVLDALRMLDLNLPLIPAFCEKAKELAKAFSRLANVWVTPNPPHTNTFLVTFPGDVTRLEQAVASVCSETGLWLVDFTRDPGIQGLIRFQVVVGAATLDVNEQEATAALARLIELMSNS